MKPELVGKENTAVVDMVTPLVVLTLNLKFQDCALKAVLIPRRHKERRIFFILFVLQVNTGTNL